MLKITVDQTPSKIILRLEGSLSGAWVSELEDTWRTSVDGTGRDVCVDLAATYGIDAAGRYLLTSWRRAPYRPPRRRANSDVHYLPACQHYVLQLMVGC